MSDDLRIIHWDEIASKSWLSDLRLRCYERLLRQPGTPDEIAAEFGLSILAVRPRCSELRKGLPSHVHNPIILAQITGERRGGAHVLCAIPYEQALAAWRQRSTAHTSPDPRARITEAARIMGRRAHTKSREADDTGQMNLLTA